MRETAGKLERLQRLLGGSLALLRGRRVHARPSEPATPATRAGPWHVRHPPDGWCPSVNATWLCPALSDWRSGGEEPGSSSGVSGDGVPMSGRGLAAPARRMWVWLRLRRSSGFGQDGETGPGCCGVLRAAGCAFRVSALAWGARADLVGDRGGESGRAIAPGVGAFSLDGVQGDPGRGSERGRYRACGLSVGRRTRARRPKVDEALALSAVGGGGRGGPGEVLVAAADLGQTEG